MSKKFFIETFGCQMNSLDSEKIAGNLSQNGMEITDSPSKADVIILNTCSVRDKAVQKVYARLGEIKHHKKQRQDLIIGIVGCMAQLEGDKILKRAPHVNILAGPQKSYTIYSLIEKWERTRTASIDMRSDENPGPLEISPILRGNAWRASVTISEGCNRHCAYCVVPATRGKERMRSSKYILGEVAELVAKGYIEIMLLGQTVNSYVDRKNGNVTFAELLRQMARIPGIRRIRFTSPYPSDFTDEFLDVMISCPQVCNHIHLPVQSGSTRVLQAMKRGYAREDYLEIVQKIQQSPRPISISTDLIVGFPGEEEKDFEHTLTLLDDAQFDSAFSFKYSPRPNTEALKLPGTVSEEEKSRRLSILQQRQKEIQYRKNESYLDRVLEVLVEGRARSRVRLTGRTSNNKIVNFDGPEILIGRFAKVKITGFSPNSLKGAWIPSNPLE
jgi:tRNA-2-methylthio-N6-dimethylallyladenosine synthase